MWKRVDLCTSVQVVSPCFSLRLTRRTNRQFGLVNFSVTTVAHHNMVGTVGTWYCFFGFTQIRVSNRPLSLGVTDLPQFVLIQSKHRSWLSSNLAKNRLKLSLPHVTVGGPTLRRCPQHLDFEKWLEMLHLLSLCNRWIKRLIEVSSSGVSLNKHRVYSWPRFRRFRVQNKCPVISAFHVFQTRNTS